MLPILPSVIAHIVNGVLLLISLIFLINNFSKIKNLKSHTLLKLILLFSIAIGIHGLSHLGLEKSYGYTPLNILT